MNYKKATILVTHDWLTIQSIHAIERTGNIVMLYNGAGSISPWARKESKQKELELLLKWLSGAGYHPNITYQDDNAIIYDINFINLKNGSVYRQAYCK